MNTLELMKLTKKAQYYRQDAKASLLRNNHMNEIRANQNIDQKVIDAVLVDFINYIGMKEGIDFGLYTVDLISL